MIENYPKQNSKQVNLDENGKQLIHPFKLTKDDSLKIAKFIAYDLANDWNYIISKDEENDEETFKFGYRSDDNDTYSLEEEEL